MIRVSPCGWWRRLPPDRNIISIPFKSIFGASIRVGLSQHLNDPRRQSAGCARCVLGLRHGGGLLVQGGKPAHSYESYHHKSGDIVVP
jgi:hypothetical protein